jgi:hypothetical protein
MRAQDSLMMRILTTHLKRSMEVTNIMTSHTCISQAWLLTTTPLVFLILTIHKLLMVMIMISTDRSLQIKPEMIALQSKIPCSQL